MPWEIHRRYYSCQGGWRIWNFRAELAPSFASRQWVGIPMVEIRYLPVVMVAYAVRWTPSATLRRQAIQQKGWEIKASMLVLSARREFLRQILYKNITIIAIQRGKFILLTPLAIFPILLGDNHSSPSGKFPYTYQLKLPVGRVVITIQYDKNRHTVY